MHEDRMLNTQIFILLYRRKEETHCEIELTIH